jgi:hypothetical protein
MHPGNMSPPKPAVIEMSSGEWLFQCPECEFSHIEFECLAIDDDLHCIVCLEERRVTVRLRRWAAQPEPARQT